MNTIVDVIEFGLPFREQLPRIQRGKWFVGAVGTYFYDIPRSAFLDFGDGCLETLEFNRPTSDKILNFPNRFIRRRVFGTC